MEVNCSKKKKHIKLILFVFIAALAASIITALVFVTNNFAVKETTGIKLFISDQTEVERVALKLKQRFGNPNSPQYKQTLKAYDQTVMASDKYIQEIKIEVKLNQIIDFTLNDYENSPSNVKSEFSSFIQAGNEVLGSSAAGLELANESTEFAFVLLDKILELKDSESQKAVSRLTNTLNNTYMVEYADLSREKLLEKYRKQ